MGFDGSTFPPTSGRKAPPGFPWPNSTQAYKVTTSNSLAASAERFDPPIRWKWKKCVHQAKGTSPFFVSSTMGAHFGGISSQPSSWLVVSHPQESPEFYLI